MGRLRRAFGRDQRGVIAVEFALLLPVMLIALFGSFEITRLVRASIRLTNTAQTIADLVAQQDTVSTTTMSNICTGGQYVMTPFSASSLVASVASVTYSGTTRAVDWQDVTCGSGTTISTAASLATAYTPNAKDSAIVVRATYAYTPILNTVLTSTFTMTRYAYARPRNGTGVGHS